MSARPDSGKKPKTTPPTHAQEDALWRSVDEAARADDEDLVRELVERFMASHGSPNRALWSTVLQRCLIADSVGGVRAIGSLLDLSRPFVGLDPVRVACEGSPRALRELLAQGASPARRDKAGHTPLLDMASNSMLFSFDFRSNRDELLECVRALWEAGDAARADAKTGETPLEVAAGNFNEQPFHEILRLGGAGLANRRVDQLLTACLSSDSSVTIRRFEALAPLLPAEAWTRSGIARAAAGRGDESIVVWLLDRQLGFGNPSDACEALEALIPRSSSGWRPQMSTIERLLPLCGLCGDFEEPGGALLLHLLVSLPPALARSDRVLPYLDLIAAFNPLQPGAKELWASVDGDASRMPRLHARVEAEILRQAIGESMGAAATLSTTLAADAAPSLAPADAAGEAPPLRRGSVRL
jgi:hypothetical protein